MAKSGDEVKEGLADAKNGADSAEIKTLYHYTNEEGLNGITKSNQLNPSLKVVNPSDARYGNGQYLTDIVPGTKTPAQLSREHEQRNELRKIELFKNGKAGYASENVEFGGSGLSKFPLPEIEEIAQDSQFNPIRITKEEFETVWNEKVHHKE
ncbi:MAG: HYD1 signature containing ADP-ribosyltransferase family protein [Eubacteriaceae bacterium]